MDDPFGNMREQMERERDNFFKTVNPRDWPSDSSLRGGMFNRPRTSFGGFPSGPADLPGHHSLPRSRREPGAEGGSEQGDQSDPDLSIPIRVIHEKPRPRYGQAAHSNTTELPAKAAAGSESPRLERAHSEPPGKFKQRLNISNPSAYTTIPEYGETGETGRASSRSSRPSNFNISLEPSNPIKTSASAPSVPGSGHHSQPATESQPAPPPRRSPPRAGGMAGQGAPGGNIRHIPIFVEGRQEPIFNQSGQQSGELPFSKPSDYYPAGVQRVNSQQEGGAGPLGEPTTPLGPPPGPIPMGYTPHTPHQQSLQPGPAPAEPTTPLGPPAGPIPMGYIAQPEDFLKPHQNPQEPTTPQGPPPGPIPMGFLPSQEGDPLTADEPKVAPPVPPQRNRSQTQQAPVSCEEQDIARKLSAELPSAADNTKRKESESSDNRKDPLVNVIPIKIDQSRPESPRPPNQEPGLKPNMNATPAPAPATKTEAPPPPAANPKIAKLDKIQGDVEMLMEKIQKFDGSKTDKEYLYLDEMLTRHLISLDGIDPEGQVEIRQLRKESIKSVNRCLSLLDRKVSEVTEAEADHNNQVLSELAEKSDKKTS